LPGLRNVQSAKWMIADVDRCIPVRKPGELPLSRFNALTVPYGGLSGDSPVPSCRRSAPAAPPGWRQPALHAPGAGGAAGGSAPPGATPRPCGTCICGGASLLTENRLEANATGTPSRIEIGEFPGASRARGADRQVGRARMRCGAQDHARAGPVLPADPVPWVSAAIGPDNLETGGGTSAPADSASPLRGTCFRSGVKSSIVSVTPIARIRRRFRRNRLRGDVFPGTVVCGAGRSGVGHTGCPVIRSKDSLLWSAARPL
jgi:hypothetical protein